MIEEKIKRDIFNGALTGYISVFITQPLQVVRTSMMVSDRNGKASRMTEIYKKIKFEEGFHGFYRGLIPAMVKTTLGSAIFFGTLEVGKKYLQKWEDKLSFHLINFKSAAFARIVQSILMNPLVVVKTRYEVVGFNKYTSLANALKTIYIEEGVRGYFTGLKAGLMKDVPSTALFYSLYEFFKVRLHKMGLLNIHSQAICASLMSTLLLCVLNNPLDVIKIRSQYHYYSQNKNHEYKGIISGVAKIAKNEGIRGLCSGMVPKMIKKGLSSTLVWTLYEGMKIRD